MRVVEILMPGAAAACHLVPGVDKYAIQCPRPMPRAGELQRPLPVLCLLLHIVVSIARLNISSSQNQTERPQMPCHGSTSRDVSNLSKSDV